MINDFRFLFPGVQGDDADRFAEYQDERPRVIPVTHCWTPAGDVLVGCSGGQLLRVSTILNYLLYSPG